MSTFENEKRLALEWRNKNPHYVSGWVLLCDGVVTGWKLDLNRPETEKPGSLAINEKGDVFVSFGNDEVDGSQGWRKADKY